MQNEGIGSTMKLNGKSSILFRTFNYVIQEARSVGSGYNGADTPGNSVCGTQCLPS
jgi:hypothetical protein